jgi:hypothetical protein
MVRMIVQKLVVSGVDVSAKEWRRLKKRSTTPVSERCQSIVM